jgi:hypothetical protein
MKLLLALLVLLVGASQPSAANPCVIRHAYSPGGSPVTGEMLNAFKDLEVATYAMGVMDAWAFGALVQRGVPF